MTKFLELVVRSTSCLIIVGNVLLIGVFRQYFRVTYALYLSRHYFTYLLTY